MSVLNNILSPVSSPARFALSVGILVGFATVLVFLGTGCSSSDPLPSAHPDNPLPECPDSPNCERISRVYGVPADRLYASAQDALKSLELAALQFRPDSMRASGVDRVALFFKDDLDVAVQSHEEGSILHVRSASRMGYDDLGVNRRRILRLLSTLDQELDAE